MYQVSSLDKRELLNAKKIKLLPLDEDQRRIGHERCIEMRIRHVRKRWFNQPDGRIAWHSIPEDVETITLEKQRGAIC